MNIQILLDIIPELLIGSLLTAVGLWIKHVFFNSNIVMPVKVIIRKRTSEGFENLLTIGILVGNKGRGIIENASCKVICGYRKDNGRFCVDAESIDEDRTIENYRRFSFRIDEFPKIFWRHYLEQTSGLHDMDYLRVIVKGNVVGSGTVFRKERTYRFKDFVIDLKDPEQYYELQRWSKHLKKDVRVIDWSRFTYVEPESIDVQNVIKDEITRYVNE